MKHRLIWATLVALAVLPITAQAIYSWSQAWNNFPNNPTSCNDVGEYQCWYWPKTPNNLSTTQYVYLDSTLGQGNINITQDVRDAWARWNAQPARNPHLVETTNLGDYTIYVRRADTDYWCGQIDVWGCTHDNVLSDGHTIWMSMVYLNENVTWNRTLTYGPGNLVADSRKVITHELGHAEALGHTSYTAIMHQGDEQFYTVQHNDCLGIQAIYGSYGTCP